MTIQFFLTDAGKNAALNAASLGLNVSLKHIAIGSAKYNPLTAIGRTALVNEIERYLLNGGSVEPSSHTLRFIANIEPTITADGYEIGLFTDQGVLFAIAATVDNTPLIRLVANLVSITTFGMILSNLDLSNLIIKIDPNTPISVALMNEHLAHSDPHPQYANKAQNELEHNNLILLINAAIQSGQINLENAVDFLSSLLQQHKNAVNPHPQYLLASTFGVELEMTAKLATSIVDKNRVFGWNGENGDSQLINVSPGWWSTHEQTTRFKPYRAFGNFLLNIDMYNYGYIFISIKTYSKDNVLISDKTVYNESNKYKGLDSCKAVFELQKGGYAEIYFKVQTYDNKYSAAWGSIYVDDRVKIFKPVGYTSIVDNTDSNSGDSSVVETKIDYSNYPDFEWFYYSNSQSKYLQLSSASSFDNPVARAPHFHRALLNQISSKDLWILIEVGKQSVQTPSDYTVIETQILRGATDEQGNIVVTVPLSMRSVQIASGMKAIYTVAYYDHAVEKSGNTFPTNSLDGEHVIYVAATS
ncbi:phage tail protein [Acinetobacter sp. TUM15131]|uniref:phage tail-collar fiber domain-containing protein n=3 Tax=unclassified Acinetobacter TaxID=196816 RepID=UPI00124C2CC0|nr:phage tail protein [Acinetobacter sp. TUM15131]